MGQDVTGYGMLYYGGGLISLECVIPLDLRQTVVPEPVWV